MWLAISALLAYGAAALALEARRARGLTVARLTLAAVAAGALAVTYLISVGGYMSETLVARDAAGVESDHARLRRLLSRVRDAAVATRGVAAE